MIVRTRDSGRTLDACLASLAAQTEPVEIIVIDSGSTDDTLTIAQRYTTRIGRVAQAAFSYGGTLNQGAAMAAAPVCFALSSHCVASRRDWIATALAHYERPEVAGTNGQAKKPDGSPLTGPFDMTATTPLPNPLWCFSNHASSWRMSVWRDFPFDEELLGSEDADWSDRVTAAGHVVVFDPALLVPGDHRKAAGVRSFFHRTRRELLTIAAVRGVDAPGTRGTLRRWWSDIPAGGRRHRQLVSPYRLAELAGHWSAGRVIRRGDHHAAARARPGTARRSPRALGG